MKKKGFTLIELLVVISIIALLSSVVLASLNSARAKARDAQKRVTAKQIANAIELYRTSTGSYPATQGWFNNNCNPTTGAWTGGLHSVLVPTYIGSLPCGSAQWIYVTHDFNDGSSACNNYTAKSAERFSVTVVLEQPTSADTSTMGPYDVACINSGSNSRDMDFRAGN